MNREQSIVLLAMRLVEAVQEVIAEDHLRLPVVWLSATECNDLIDCLDQCLYAPEVLTPNETPL